MNTKEPHDIISDVDYNRLFGKESNAQESPSNRRKEDYVQILSEEARYLETRSVEERAKWLTLPFKRRLQLMLRDQS